MSKFIRSVLDTPNAAHILPNTRSLSKSKLTVILYFSVITPPLTEQFDLFELEAHESGSRAKQERIRPTEKRLSAEFQEQSLVL